MMRQLLIVALFFFGPALLMLALRLLLLYLRWRLRLAIERWRMRREILTVHPVDAPRWRTPLGYLLLSMLVGLGAAWWAWQSLQAPPPAKRIYLPAHLDPYGNVVPGRWVEVEPKQTR